MHIAICDDNAADRKQCERLMGREADTWVKAEKPIFTYSFGNVEALLSSPLEFAGILLDITDTSNMNNESVIDMLRNRGVKSVIAVMSGDIQGENIIHLNKPISTVSLHEALLEIEKLKPVDNTKVELRWEKNTMYVDPEEILYADKDGLNMVVTLTGGRVVTVYSDIEPFFDNLIVKKECFAMPTVNTIINISHIKKVGFGSAVMEDGRKVKLSGIVKKYVLSKM